MTCEIFGEDYDCATCQEIHCPADIERIYTEHAELKQAVEEAVNELERFVEGYCEVL